MKKAELIKELEWLTMKSPVDKVRQDLRAKSYNEGISAAITLLGKLDEPQKVKLPEYVVHWLDDAKSMKVSLSEAIDYDNGIISDSSKYPIALQDWLSYRDNQETFVRAWLDGYEVEKEQLYYVVFNNLGARGNCYLWIDEKDNFAYFSDKPDMGKNKFTESEIKANDERYWSFAVKVEESGDK